VLTNHRKKTEEKKLGKKKNHTGKHVTAVEIPRENTYLPRF